MTLPYFASLGHFHYQKLVSLHLQIMSQIHVTHHGLHKHFINRLHVIRRSDRFWVSLSPELVIEQNLNRSLKTSDDLTRVSKTKICLEIPFSKNSYHVEPSPLICKANQLIGFYMIRAFTETYIQIDYSTFIY